MRLLCLTSVGWMLANPAAAQLQSIDSDRATGSSAAVVVADSAALLHTSQFTTNSVAAREQIAHLLTQIERVTLRHGGKGRLVKLNFVVRRDEQTPLLQRALAAALANVEHLPAVSFVAGKLADPVLQVAVDAVVALPAPSDRKHAVVAPDAAILPPGARVWISGQAERGATLAEATRKTMASLRDSLKFVGLKPNAVIQVKAFVQPMGQVEEASKEIAAFFSGVAIPPVVVVEWKSALPIEIELVAWAGREREGVPLEFLTPPGMKASPVYSRIARVNDGKLIYLSGLHARQGGDAVTEITDIFDSLGGILKKAGSDYRHLAKATYYCTSAETVKKMGELRPRYYDPKRPPAASLALTEGTGRAGRTVTLDMIAVPAPTVSVNDYGPAEFGHGLKDIDALAGWISLFDGKTSFGWSDAKVAQGHLQTGVSTTHFGACQVQTHVVEPGELFVGDARMALVRGDCAAILTPSKPGPVRLAGGAVVKSLTIQPLKMQSIFNGVDLSGWKRIDRVKQPPTWSVAKGILHAVGGPGALEYQDRQYGDLILQVEAKMNVRHANGGLFFRAIPGDFMNGYEAQLYNRCHDGDVSKPWTWATGAIDDRQNARRLISRDGEWFVQTVMAHGPHIATWINGYQTVDWTDTRAKHENPRKGLRLEPGVIQLQAHDPGTDIEFRRIAVRALE